MTRTDELAVMVDAADVYTTIVKPTITDGSFSPLAAKTSHAPYVLYYWYPGSWRGYVREYTRGDCIDLANALGLDCPRRAQPAGRRLVGWHGACR